MASEAAQHELSSALTSTTVRLATERPRRLSQSANLHTKVTDANEDRPRTAAKLSSSKSSNQNEKREPAQRSRQKLKTSDRMLGQHDADGLGRDTEIEGWGDFDADLLLANPSDNNDSGIQLEAYMKIMVHSRPNSRNSSTKNAGRSSAPSVSVERLHKEAPRSCTAQSQSHLDISRRSEPVIRPFTEVLRQRKLEAMEFPSEPLPIQSLKRATISATQQHRKSKQQLNDDSSFYLPTLPRSATTPHLPTSRDPIFGSDIPNDEATRRLVGGSLLKLWNLMSPTDQSSKSSFECSITVLKLCKSVGISLLSAGPTSLSFWRSSSHANDEYVEFSEFFDFAIRGIFQPALHHFKLDQSIDDFVQTMESILASLIEDSLNPSKKLKELGDVYAMLPVWKTGIPVCQDHEKRASGDGRRNVDSPETDETEQRGRQEKRAQSFICEAQGVSSHDKITTGLEAPGLKRISTQQLNHEAQELHNRSIQQKVQLRTSWKRKSVPTSRTNSSLDPIQSNTLAVKGSGADNAKSFDVNAPQLSANLLSSVEKEDKEMLSNPEMVEEDLLLLCSACSIHSALLWCSSCFSVLCETCWNEIHHSVVDTSQLHGNLTMASPPLCPTVFPLQKVNGDDSVPTPEIPFVYLPTKTLSPKRKPKILSSVLRWRTSSEDCASLPITGIVSHSVLPTVAPNLKTSTSTSEQEHTENPNQFLAMADLTKSLMLGAVPRRRVENDSSDLLTSKKSSLGVSSSIPTLAVLKHYQRPTLRSAAVILDASVLLPSASS